MTSIREESKKGSTTGLHYVGIGIQARLTAGGTEEGRVPMHRLPKAGAVILQTIHSPEKSGIKCGCGRGLKEG